jgi:hypothetical protein
MPTYMCGFSEIAYYNFIVDYYILGGETYLIVNSENLMFILGPQNLFAPCHQNLRTGFEFSPCVFLYWSSRRFFKKNMT